MCWGPAVLGEIICSDCRLCSASAWITSDWFSWKHAFFQDGNLGYFERWMCPSPCSAWWPETRSWTFRKLKLSFPCTSIARPELLKAAKFIYSMKIRYECPQCSATNKCWNLHCAKLGILITIFLRYSKQDRLHNYCQLLYYDNNPQYQTFQSFLLIHLFSHHWLYWNNSNLKVCW